jgi:GT2 family glycosyltransferase/glycosyltransferase involved in cell wall biosynthesis
MATRLHITHSWGGGVGRWVSDFCRGDSTRRSLLLRSRTDRNHAAYQLELLDAAQAAAPLSTWHLRAPIRTTDVGNPEYRSILHAVIAAHGVGDVVVSSLLGHTLEALDTGLPTVVVLHDLYPFCPALFGFFGSPCSACEGGRLQRCLQVNPHNVFWHNSTAQDWLSLREAYVERLGQPWLALAAPTACVHDRWAALLPAFAGLPWHRIAHGLDLARFAPAPRPPSSPTSALRVVVPGRLAPHKGLHLLRQALPQLQGTVEVLLLGCGDYGRVFDGVPGVRIVPEYALERLPAEIGDFDPDCALLLSVLPESYSYTLSEMQALNVPVLATRLGAFVERIEDERTGLLFEPHVDGLLTCVRRVAAERAVLSGIAANLAKLPRRGLADMVRDYDALLAALPSGRQRPAAAAVAARADAAAALPSPGDEAQARARNEVRGTFYLADTARIVFAFVPAGDTAAAARCARVALACTAARNDVHFYVVGASECAPSWGTHRDDIVLLMATRRLFFVDGRLSRDSLLAGADAFLSLAGGEAAMGDELAALHAGQMLLTFGPWPPPRRARCGGQAAILIDAQPEAAATALSYWLERSDAERARVAARTRDALTSAGSAAAAVVAVVVTHQPAPERLAALLAALSPQVDRVILVDNGSQPPVEPWLRAQGCPNLDPLLLPENIGLAAAQNAGIARARELGADFVVLSDQDSVPEAGMVEALLNAVWSLRQQGQRVAAVGPRYREADGVPGPFVRLRGLRYQRLDCGDRGDIVEVDHLIASGCLIPLPVLDEVGDMTAELFIDYVDVEWGLRARRAGYRCFGVCAAGMRHERGQVSLRILGRTVPLHEPLRLYYQHRNAVWLMRQNWLGRRWKFANALRLARNLCVYALLPGSRLARWKMALTGTLDGLRGNMGRARIVVR